MMHLVSQNYIIISLNNFKCGILALLAIFWVLKFLTILMTIISLKLIKYAYNLLS